MIRFKRVLIHNFGSYGHTELDLQNKGFCLVSGENNFSKDNALSNGSGKSFIWSAICYALTGETINGVRTNLKNIHVEDSTCYVQVEFVYNNDFYSIQRVATPKTDLKIFKNDVDVSGKGIRESEHRLAELLPELSKNLIASTIIIGQGMPNKFSAFSPSGRKELLEKLTKSDFMIEDIKARIQDRLSSLNLELHNFENSLLLNNSQLGRLQAESIDLTNSIAQQQQFDFDSHIGKLEHQLNELIVRRDAIIAELLNIEQQIDDITAKHLACTEDKLRLNNEELSAYSASYAELCAKQASINFELLSVDREIAAIQSITDTCPTCNQKLPNIHKPDTAQLELRRQGLYEQKTQIDADISACNEKHKTYVAQIDEAFKAELDSLTNSLNALKNLRNQLTSDKQRLDTEIDTVQTAYNKACYDKQNISALLAKLIDKQTCIEKELHSTRNLIDLAELGKDEVMQRLTIVRKMESLTKRDFRGYLLSNIISYIERKARDYCSIVFNTRDLSLALNGNALDIEYCGRAFDGLSGGEKQRVDLILQLAIRDLLTTYLNISSNILVLDEITDFLDKRSCAAIMQLLETELKEIESVFIISHHSEELALPIDSTIHVIKNEHGISEIY